VILAAEFHPAIAQALVQGATETLRGHGVLARNLSVLWVPGAFELPVVAARVAAARPRPDAIIALGAVIRGQTPQYQVIANAAAQGLSHIALTHRLPVTFGVVVAETLAQARSRAGGSQGNRGAEAARAALEVLRLFEEKIYAQA
jgi:6,7-dimethyl-8-ribityllumazine synthase